MFKNEFDLDIQLLLGDVEGILNDLSDPVWSGPYNQVTSQSFNLGQMLPRGLGTPGQAGGWLWPNRRIHTYQFRVSGDMVFNLFFDFVHVLHDAFSNLALFWYALPFDTICFHDDQRSSSFQLCDK